VGAKVERLSYSIKTKLGQAFVAGDVVLVQRHSVTAMWTSTTAYSLRNNANTAI